MENSEFENIFNFRDVSQLQAISNFSITPGRLFRSGFPFIGTNKDIQKLSDVYNIKHLIDFRSDEEIEQNPIPSKLNNAFIYHHLPVVKSWPLYIKTNTNIKVNNNQKFSIKDVSEIYRTLPFWKDCQNAYQKFIDILISSNDDPVLWFCSWGKDRTGIAAIILEYVLGLNWESIYNDYLLTNRNYENILKTKKNLPNNLINTFSNPSFYVNKIYIKKMLDDIQSKCGSFKVYLEKYMKINDEKIDFLKNKYIINSN